MAIFVPNVMSYNDYYPFEGGTYRKCPVDIFSERASMRAGMSTRHESSDGYRYGFQGQELDNEVKGTGNSLNYKYRMHDPRLGRFFAVDPLAPEYSYNSPYAFSENVVINAGELEGLEKYYTTTGEFWGQVGDDTSIRVVNDDELTRDAFYLAYRTFNNAQDAKYFSDRMKSKSESLYDYAENVSDVLDDAELESYSTHQNCNTAANAQMDKAGYEKSDFGDVVINTSVDNSQQVSTPSLWRGHLEENKIGGAIYIMTQLKEGNPVMVGVDDGDADQGNGNALTGHFIIITSMSKSNNNIDLGYYDNGSYLKGKSSNNQLNVNTITGAMTDTTDLSVQGSTSYEVTEVREPKKKK